MNPSDWIYHLNLRTMVERNGFLDPCARAQPRRHHPRRAPLARRLAAGAAVLGPVAWLVAAILHG